MATDEVITPTRTRAQVVTFLYRNVNKQSKMLYLCLTAILLARC